MQQICKCIVVAVVVVATSIANGDSILGVSDES
jgi:hypothetical protein